MRPRYRRFLKQMNLVASTVILASGCETYGGFACEIHGRFLRSGTGEVIQERRVRSDFEVALGAEGSPTCATLSATDTHDVLATERDTHGTDGFIIRRMRGHSRIGRYSGHLFLPCDSKLVAEEGSLADEVVNMVPIPITISAKIGQCVGELGDVLLDVRTRPR